jgi:hypothetical protein
MVVIWGYSPDSKLPKNKVLGNDISEVKQVFSALLFTEGINGIIIRIESVKGQSEIVVKLVVDDINIISTNCFPKEAGDFEFNTNDLVKPTTKIEVIVKIIKGCIHLPTSVIGNGMGFQKREEGFQPTNHLGVGLVI